MSQESVRAHLAQVAPELQILETAESTATVALAAKAHSVAPDMIAKTLAFRVGATELLVVASGLARVDNKKMRSTFGGKAKMLSADEVLAITGHPVGGVCPFGLATELPIYLDLGLQKHAEVVPAAGSHNSAVRLTPERLAQICGGIWVDVCSYPDPAGLVSS